LISDLFLNRATRLAAFPAFSVPLLPAFSPRASAVLLADAEVAEPVSPVRAAGFAAALRADSALDGSVRGDCLAEAQLGDSGSPVAVAVAFLDSAAAYSPAAHYSYARWELAAWADDLADSRAVAERAAVGELHSADSQAVEWVAAGDWHSAGRPSNLPDGT
jgi:hypothetical protein